MPFIDIKITEKLTEAQKETVKSQLGSAVAILHKPESYLMVGIDDGYSLYFAGKKLEKGAYVAVSLYGSASASAYETMTGKLCEILSDNFSIPGDAIYVTYREVDNWGWDGSNF